MSWDLKAGEMKEAYVTDEEIWMILNHFFYQSNATTTYKYGFFKALLENLYEVNDKLELHYDKIFYSFTKTYWNLVIHHSLWQSNSKSQKSKIQSILEHYQVKYAIPSDFLFDQLSSEIQLQILRDIKNNGKKYVIGALYGDLDAQIYTFNLKKEYLQFNPVMYHFFQRFHKIITNILNFALAKFLEKYNEVPQVDYLLTKVECISKRSSLKEFYEILIAFDKQQCFYCSKQLTQGARTTHVDHFIPWSYIQTDQLWNLVLACQTCNTSKSNKLADVDFLYLVLERNDGIIGLPQLKPYFDAYHPNKLQSLYDFSQVNGFKGRWGPGGLRL